MRERYLVMGLRAYNFMNICIIGDSITYGEGDLEMGGWVQRMRLSIENSLSAEQWVNVYSLGIPGDTTDGVLPRIRNEISTRDPFLTIVAVGINDSAYRARKDNNDVPFEQFRKSILAILEIADELSENVLCVGLTRVDEEQTQPLPDSTTGKCYANDIIEKYDDAIEDLCDKEGVQYIQVSGALSKEDLIDGLHPSSVGYLKLQKIIEPVVRVKLRL